MVAADKNENG